MGIPVLTILALIFVVWLQYEIRKNSRHSKTTEDQFWKREKEANATRRKDISVLPYLTITLDSLPMQDLPDDTLNSYRDTIRSLSEKKLLNLSGISNTDLKYQYGVANLSALTEYDNNYIVFVSMMQKWAERLYHGGYLPEAQAVLEYSVSCQSDVTKSYRLLAELYQSTHQMDRIQTLITMVPKTQIPDKEKLIAELSSFQT